MALSTVVTASLIDDYHLGGFEVGGSSGYVIPIMKGTSAAYHLTTVQLRRLGHRPTFNRSGRAYRLRELELQVRVMRFRCTLSFMTRFIL